MIRSVRTFAFMFLLSLAAQVVRAQDFQPADPHIRPQSSALQDALATGVKASSTLRDIVGRVEASDVIVYLVFEPSRVPGLAAHVSFISAGGGRRYLHIGIDPRFDGSALIGFVGHELQHAAEIAAEASVVDQQSLATHYRRVGFGRSVGTREHFESDRAIEAGGRVAREAHAFLAAEARAVHSSR